MCSSDLTTSPTFVSATSNSTSSTIAINGILTYTAEFIIDQQAVDSRSVNNSVLVTASSPGNTNDVNDVSDDGNDSDGNTINDPTVTVTNFQPNIEVTKTASTTDTNNNGLVDLGDTISYTILVKNTGNTSLSGVNVTDNLTDANGGVLSLNSGPTFVGSDQGSAQGNLKVSETASYTASFIINQQSIDRGAVTTGGNPGQVGVIIKNSAIAKASSPGNTNDVTDVSDDGDDSDGNTTNDQTEVTLR